jgi:O-antigen ligase
MNTTVIKLTKSYFHKKGILITIALFIAIVTAIAIADTKWIYLGALLAPLFIYFSIKKPFIFPFGAYVFLLPFDEILSITGSSRGTTLTKLLGILTILVLFLKGLLEKKLKWPDKAAICWVLLVIYGLLSVSWAIEPARVLSRFFTAIGLLVLYLVISSYKINKSELNTCKWFILFGGFIAAIFAIYYYETGILYGGSTRVTMAFGERATNPNNFAFALIIPIAICIDLLLNQKKKMIKVALIVALGTILFGIIVTGSRGGFLGIGMIFIVYFLSVKQKLTFGTVLIATGIALVSFIPDLYVFFTERWSTAIETGGTGRLAIWYVGLDALRQYWTIGAGLNNFPNVYNEFAHLTPFSLLGRGSHNSYLGVFVELGIVGFSLFVWGITKHYQSIKLYFTYHDNNKVMLKAAFWAILVSSFFLDTLWIKSFWLLWMMILMRGNVFEMRVYKYR